MDVGQMIVSCIAFADQIEMQGQPWLRCNTVRLQSEMINVKRSGRSAGAGRMIFLASSFTTAFETSRLIIPSQAFPYLESLSDAFIHLAEQTFRISSYQFIVLTRYSFIILTRKPHTVGLLTPRKLSFSLAGSRDYPITYHAYESLCYTSFDTSPNLQCLSCIKP